MSKRLVEALVVLIFSLVMYQVAISNETESEEVIFVSDSTNGPFAGVLADGVKIASLPLVEEAEVEVVAEEEPVSVLKYTELYSLYIKMGYTDDDFDNDLELLAKIVLAEAGNQSELGKRLVIDVILNRIDSDCWRDDDTIREVVTHPGQFQSYSNGMYLGQVPTEEVCTLIIEELMNRTNYDVTYFKTDGYFAGLPQILKEGDHYFSGDVSR